jgi:hypothetical protein
MKFTGLKHPRSSSLFLKQLYYIFLSECRIHLDNYICTIARYQLQVIMFMKSLSWRFRISNSVELSPIREATSCAASREFPWSLWKPKFHNHIHKSCPSVPILRQTNSVHTTPSYLCKINLNVIHPPTTWSSLSSLSIWLSHIRAICPAHLIFLDLIILIIFG